MNTRETIRSFNRNNAPFFIAEHDSRHFSLGLNLNAGYGQFAFNRYAEQIGDPVSKQGLYTHGSGYEWETVFRKAFEDDHRISLLTFDCESGGFFCDADDLSLLTDLGQQFRELCEDSERFTELVCLALQENEELPEQISDFQTDEIIRLQLSCYSKMNHKTYHAEITLPVDQAGYEDVLHRLRCMNPETDEIQIAVEDCIFPVLCYMCPSGTLSEYNAFAKRLKSFPEQKRIEFFGALKDFLNKAPEISMRGLINLTYTAGPVSVISNVRKETEVYDGEHLPKELLPEETPFELHGDGSISSPIFPLNQVLCRAFDGTFVLSAIEQNWNNMNSTQRMTFKAILEAEKPINLNDALYLMKAMHRFKVSLFSNHDDEFAKLFLQYHIPLLSDNRIFEHLSLYDLGTEILKQMHVTMTCYGAVSEYGGSLYKKIGNVPDPKYRRYDLIGICGQKALYSPRKLFNRDIPEGLYCYDIRTDKNGKPGTLENNVYAGHGGSVIFRKPIHLGKIGYIEFDEQTAPDFLGDEMSVEEFTAATFDEGECEDLELKPNL